MLSEFGAEDVEPTAQDAVNLEVVYSFKCLDSLVTITLQGANKIESRKGRARAASTCLKFCLWSRNPGIYPVFVISTL